MRIFKDALSFGRDTSAERAQHPSDPNVRQDADIENVLAWAAKQGFAHIVTKQNFSAGMEGVEVLDLKKLPQRARLSYTMNCGSTRAFTSSTLSTHLNLSFRHLSRFKSEAEAFILRGH